MNLLRRTRESHFREPRLLDSRTPGVAFEMTGSACWKARRTRHPDIEAVVRDAVVQRARAIAITRHADDIRGTQDAINADLGAIPRGGTRYYSDLRATVTLQLRGEAEDDALRYRRSIAHIEGLRFLKKQLYSDPSMLLLDYLDKNPAEVAEPPDLARFQKLALKVSKGERWWCWVLDVLDKLSSEISDQDGNFYLVTVLFEALKDAAPELFRQSQVEEHAIQHGNPDLAATTASA